MPPQCNPAFWCRTTAGILWWYWFGMRVPVSSADRISSCAILLAGAVGGVLVFVVALPLALSSPFPTPRQSEWIIQTPASREAADLRTPPITPEPMEPLQGELVTVAYPGQPETVALTERQDPATWEVAATAIPASNEVLSIELPADATHLAPLGKTASPGKAVDAASPRRLSVSASDPIDRYLWEVYQRKPVKSDSTGDFTWKDPAAAKRLGMSLKAYVIGGMDPDFREQLYHAGHAMDANGIRWSMLSAFRDDYRQSLAAGFKAHGGNSQHGGSNATGGYGHGRAIDITSADGESRAVWHWIDTHGVKFGLRRPMPGPDPAHIQPRNTFHDLGRQLREARLKLDSGLSGIATATVSKTKVAAQVNDAAEGRGVSR
jgi:hypothetical protein